MLAHMCEGWKEEGRRYEMTLHSVEGGLEETSFIYPDLRVKKVNGPGGEDEGLTRLHLKLDGGKDMVQVSHKLKQTLL